MLTKDPENARAVYLAPTKALCSERTRDWSARFGSVGCGVAELTGDSVHGLHVARKSRLIVTTPEKWDSLTRKWDENSGILSTIRLLLIDEVHILNEAQRGARLEVVVTRTRSRGCQVRFVAVSATVPNLADVAAWIGPNLSASTLNTDVLGKFAAEVFQFDDEYRPCPLQKHVYGYPKAKDEFAFQAYLNHKLYDLIEAHAAGRPCLVFCATRRSTLQAANTLAEACKKAREAGGGSTLMGSGAGRRGVEAATFDDPDLTTLVPLGIAFHHAGLSISDRRKVEQAFLTDKIAVLCCTTTLATGINLPAYCVIVRGTKQYDGRWCEISELDIIQMMGRAGRPQFDRSGVAVIMCEDTMQAHYRDLVSGSRDIESSLAPCLIEHVNAEIGLRCRTTEAQIEDWIRQSFMWTRLQKNPTYYLSQEEGIGLDSVEEILKHLVTRTITALEEASLISRSAGTNEIECTEYGVIMSRFFIRHKTMLALMEIPTGANTRAILQALSQAEELGDQRMRPGEKTLYNTLRAHPEIRFPPRQIASVADKISLLIQAQLSAINLSQISQSAVGEASPQMDIKRIMPQATRIARAIVDIAIHRRDGTACRASLDLARSIAAEAWDGSPAMLRQIDQIGDRSVKALANAGITTWQSLASTTPAKIEMILNRNPPFGGKVIAAAQSVPRIGLEVMQRSSSPSRISIVDLPQNRIEDPSASTTELPPFSIKVVLDVTIRIENRATCMLKSKRSKMALSVCVLTLTSDGGFVDFRRMPIWRFDSEKRFTMHVHLENPRKRILTYAACDEIAGTLMQANLLPITDMTNGSHRTRIVRAELQRGGMSEHAAEIIQTEAGASESFASGDTGESQGVIAMPREPELDEDAMSKRCKHKCKGDCRHVCCQRARVQELTDKVGQYGFQRRGLQDKSQSSMGRYLQPFPMPSSESSALSQKRKAGFEPRDDATVTQGLLSRLIEQDAEFDRVFGDQDALQMPFARKDGFTSASLPRRGADTREVPGASHGSIDELRAHAHTHLPTDVHERGRDVSSARMTGSHEQGPSSRPLASLVDEAQFSPPIERPPQRRFLKDLSLPAWLDSTGEAS